MMLEKPNPHFEAISESALLVHLEQRIEPEVNARVQALCARIERADIEGLTGIMPAYASVLIRFDPDAWREHDGTDPHAALWQRVCPHVQAVCASDYPAEEVPGALHRLPVCYGNEHGEDLASVAEHCGMSVDEVIRLHSEREYRVAMLGFAPGFAYLLGLDPALQMARHEQPRTRVPAGSVGIGGAQTGIYPRQLPGGWQLLGRTPVPLFDAQHNPPALLAPGDRVRFEPIDAEEFDKQARTSR